MRIFAFGCSFTSYCWPTWADIIARSLGGHYENWAQGGGGNLFILNRFVECMSRNRITTGDIVLIMWSTVFREDRYIHGRWVTPGNIYNQKRYDSGFMKYFDERGAFLQSCNAMLAINRWATNCGARVAITSLLPFDHCFNEYDLEYQVNRDIIDHYRPHLADMLADYYSRMVNGKPWPTFPLKEYMDHHPLPRDHLRFAEEVIAPHLGISITEETREWVAHWQNIVAEVASVEGLNALWQQRYPICF